MNIKIFDDIGEFAPVNFNDIVAQIESIPAEDKEINLLINSHGGECFEALKIYDALRETGKEITAHVVGECSSAATLLLLAAGKGHRTANPNATILIHNPYCMSVGDANEFKQISEELQQITNRFISIYVERTGTSAEDLAAVMNENKPMDAPRALQLGFIDSIKTPISNYFSMSKTIKSAFVALGRALGVLALSVETADGQTLEFEREDGAPEIGDKVGAPDGNYLMPNGETYVIKGGELVEILPAENNAPAEEPEPEPAEPEPVPVDEEPEPKPSEEPAEDETEELKKQIEELKKQIEELKANAKSDADREILAAVNVAGGREWLAKVTSGAANFAPKTEPAEPGKKSESFKDYYNRINKK